MISKRDLYFAISTGIVTGVIAWRLTEFLHFRPFPTITKAWLIIIVPLCWIAGIWFGNFLSRFVASVKQFSRFVAIGFTNAAIDFAYLNIVMYFSGITHGKWYAVIRACAFIFATINSFLLNKYWTFQTDKKDIREFASFVIITTISLIINVFVSTYIVTYIDPLFGMRAQQWANIGAVTGSAISLIVNFTGYKLLVFKK